MTAISFTITAPGKVILFGEHAVVYGKTAVAASLNRRTRLHFEELPGDECIQLKFLDVKLACKLKVEAVRNLLGNLAHSDHTPEVAKDFRKMNFSEYGDTRVAKSIDCFIYALMLMVRDTHLELRGFKLEVESELPLGAGVGSSASFSVCLVASLLRWSQLQRNPVAPLKFDKDNLHDISRYAYECEKIMHGSPSGVDNSICTYGSVIEFRKGEPLEFISLGNQSLRILLVDTVTSRDTKQLVAKVATGKEKYPDIYDNILEAIDKVSREAIRVIKRVQFKPEDKLLETHKDLSELIHLNQGLLSSVQVSHESLDYVIMESKKAGFEAKLTGAGGGGCAYVLIPPGASDQTVKSLICQLSDNKGYIVWDTHLGGPGVLIEC